MISPEYLRELLERITPGPWRFGEYDPLEVWADRDAAGWDSLMVATTRTRLNPNGLEGSVYDTELIALAPAIARAYLDLLDRS